MADRVPNASLTKLQDKGSAVGLDHGALAHWTSRPWMLDVFKALVADAGGGEVIQHALLFWEKKIYREQQTCSM